MKKQFIALALACFSLTGFAQKSSYVPGHLYKSVEDFKAKKPLPDYGVLTTSWKNSMGKESFEITKGGDKTKTKVSELPAPFITEMENGVLMRAFDNELYYILEDGPICYYIKKTDADVVELTGPSIYSKQITSGKYIYLKNEFLPDYYSETITGEIKKLKESDLEKRLEAKGLKEKFESEKPKREKKDNISDFVTKTRLHTAKYIKLLNS